MPWYYNVLRATEVVFFINWSTSVAILQCRHFPIKSEPLSVICSINQSNFYSANIPGVARLSGATARSVFKWDVVEVVP